ncbi:HAD family hydrolase [Mucilaginibacter ginsenosidivorans]|uniref:phosphoglycolate phosphatase n=1 Tax=Mucilaginibacter ginsenosidivorans TaxID=398053 RepID=A0A5B8UYE6_9SPHI|nr:HAD family hydrolase [Mucilaginibacter ginsenosidivorans]QEC63426.1 HAD family hydrolase [Mucilaginibacter ginsenosidivorans]
MQTEAALLKNKFDSIIFDLDGTLWDSTGNVALAWEKARLQVGYEEVDSITRERVRSITGMAYDVIFEVLLPDMDIERRNYFKSVCAQSEIDTLEEIGGDLYPGLEETIKYLADRYKLYIVSNCQSGYIETFLSHCPVSGHFLAHQCYGTKGQPKAENIKDIVNDHGLQAPVYIGDTNGDRDSAAKAGVPFIFASYGFGKVAEGMVATIDTFGDLKELL